MLNREHSEHLRPTAPQSGFQTQFPLSSFWTVSVLTLLLQAHAALPRTCSPLEVLPVKSEEVVSSKSGMFSLILQRFLSHLGFGTALAWCCVRALLCPIPPWRVNPGSISMAALAPPQGPSAWGSLLPRCDPAWVLTSPSMASR